MDNSTAHVVLVSAGTATASSVVQSETPKWPRPLAHAVLLATSEYEPLTFDSLVPAAPVSYGVTTRAMMTADSEVPPVVPLLSTSVALSMTMEPPPLVAGTAVNRSAHPMRIWRPHS